MSGCMTSSVIRRADTSAAIHGCTGRGAGRGFCGETGASADGVMPYASDRFLIFMRYPTFGFVPISSSTR